MQKKVYLCTLNVACMPVRVHKYEYIHMQARARKALNKQAQLTKNKRTK